MSNATTEWTTRFYDKQGNILAEYKYDFPLMTGGGEFIIGDDRYRYKKTVTDYEARTTDIHFE